MDDILCLIPDAPKNLREQIEDRFHKDSVHFKENKCTIFLKLPQLNVLSIEVAGTENQRLCLFQAMITQVEDLRTNGNTEVDGCS